MALDRPVPGAQEHEVPPDPMSGVELPAQIAAVPEAIAVGLGFTVMTALPVPGAEPSMLDTVVTEYVVVTAGLTLRMAGPLSTTLCWKPSDQVRLHGGVPVSAAWIEVDAPAQMVALPLTWAVGAASAVLET